MLITMLTQHKNVMQIHHNQTFPGHPPWVCVGSVDDSLPQLVDVPVGHRLGVSQLGGKHLHTHTQGGDYRPCFSALEIFSPNTVI